MIGALRTGGLLERSDEGVCALARASADALDDALAYGEKLYAVSSMMRTHLMIVEALTGRARFQPGDDDGVNELLAVLQDPRWLAMDASEDVGGYRLPDRPPGWAGD
jgi:hypothetical protein